MGLQLFPWSTPATSPLGRATSRQREEGLPITLSLGARNLASECGAPGGYDPFSVDGSGQAMGRATSPKLGRGVEGVLGYILCRGTPLRYRTVRPVQAVQEMGPYPPSPRETAVCQGPRGGGPTPGSSA